MATRDFGVAKCHDIQMLYSLLAKNPRSRGEIKKRIRELTGQQKNLSRNGGKKCRSR